jgi:hypothetical protein
LAFGVGVVAARTRVVGVAVPAHEADGHTRGAGIAAAGTARGRARRGYIAGVAGSAMGWVRRVGSIVDVEVGAAAACAPGPEFGVDAGWSGGRAAQGASPNPESSKATTRIDGHADRPIIPFPSPSGFRGAMSWRSFRIIRSSGFIG